MGSYATLSLGEFSLGEWKSHVPLEPLLLFTQEDFHEIPPEGEDGWTRHKFITTARVAQVRMNFRGFTLATCRRLFEEFKSVAFYRPNGNGEGEYVTNTTTFEQFLDACREVKSKSISWYFFHESEVSKEVQELFEQGLFDDSIVYYFDDVHFCIMARAFLEVAHPDEVVEFDVSELISGGYLPDISAEKLYDHYMSVTLQRIGLDYQLYGFVIENDPNVNARLRTRIESLDEDAFIKHVLVPLLQKMGFESVRAVDSHGRNEFGSDIRPFRQTTQFGTMEYYAVQAKAVQIHGTSSASGNAGELISQATQAFNIPFIDELDSERKKIDKFIIATSKSITPDARRVIEESFEGTRKLILIDIEKIIDLVKKHRLLQYLLFTELE